MAISSMIPVLTIWIHGTFPQDLIPARYAHIRPLQYIKNHYYCPPGLNEVAAVPTDYMYYQLMHLLATRNPEMFPLKNLYLFGWSGRLSHEDRIKGGKALYKALKKLVKEKYLDQPVFIRILAHSHGGNVALNMALEFNEEEQENPRFFIDELIMMGTPAQQITIPHTKSPLFKQIFNVHSHSDIIQIGDPQGMPTNLQELKELFATLTGKNANASGLRKKPFFSRRHFPVLPNLKNIRVQIDGRDVYHIEYILESFFKRIPFMIDAFTHPDSPYLYKHSRGDYLLNFPK